MDNRTIEVIIGLVLVFALTSLVVTTVHEAFASKSKARGKNLLLGLCSFLGDNGLKKGGMFKGNQAVPSAFTEKLLSHPLLLSQAVGQKADVRRPSYLDSEVVISALLAQLSQMYCKDQRPDTPQQWVNAVTAGIKAAEADKNDLRPTNDLRDGLTALLHGAETDWRAYEQRLCAWYDSVMDRAVGWYTRQTHKRLFFMGFAVAALLNVNPLVIVPRLWADPALRAEMTSAAIETSKVYSAALAASNPEAVTMAASAATTAMNKTSAPAKTTSASARPLSAEALQLDRRLSELKGRFFNAAKAFKEHPLDDRSRQVRRALDSTMALSERLVQWRASLELDDYPITSFSLAGEVEMALQGLQQSVALAAGPEHTALERDVTDLYSAFYRERAAALPREATQAVRNGRVICPEIDDPKAQRMCAYSKSLQTQPEAALPVGWGWPNWPACDLSCQVRHAPKPLDEVLQYSGKRAYAEAVVATARTPSDTLRAKFEEERAALLGAAQTQHSQNSFSPWKLLEDGDLWLGLLLALPGWLITALATMLGAPFWFDLLAKFIKLRGAPSSSSDKTASGAAPGGTPGGAGPRTTLTPASPTPTPRDAPAPPPPAPVPVPPRVAPLAPSQLGRTPRRTDGSINVLTELEVRDAFGDIQTLPDAHTHGFVTITSKGAPGKVQHALVPFAHPALAGKPGGSGLMVHALALPHFSAVFDEIATTNAADGTPLADKILSCGGSFVARHIGSKPDRPLSRHTWGIAIDLNAAQNGLGQEPAALNDPGSLLELLPIFEKVGFAWGGHFTTGKDGMHFELALRKP